jgi:hypothetical protein
MRFMRSMKYHMPVVVTTRLPTYPCTATTGKNIIQTRGSNNKMMMKLNVLPTRIKQVTIEAIRRSLRHKQSNPLLRRSLRTIVKPVRFYDSLLSWNPSSWKKIYSSIHNDESRRITTTTNVKNDKEEEDNSDVNEEDSSEENKRTSIQIREERRMVELTSAFPKEYKLKGIPLLDLSLYTNSRRKLPKGSIVMGRSLIDKDDKVVKYNGAHINSNSNTNSNTNSSDHDVHRMEECITDIRYVMLPGTMKKHGIHFLKRVLPNCLPYEDHRPNTSQHLEAIKAFNEEAKHLNTKLSVNVFFADVVHSLLPKITTPKKIMVLDSTMFRTTHHMLMANWPASLIQCVQRDSFTYDLMVKKQNMTLNLKMLSPVYFGSLLQYLKVQPSYSHSVFALDYCGSFYGNQEVDMQPQDDLKVIFEQQLFSREEGILWTTFCTRRTYGAEGAKHYIKALAKANGRKISLICQSLSYGLFYCILLYFIVFYCILLYFIVFYCILLASLIDYFFTISICVSFLGVPRMYVSMYRIHAL